MIRTLRIITLLKDKNIISYRKAVNACYLLKECPTTRIPEKDIDDLIEKFNKDSVTS